MYSTVSSMLRGSGRMIQRATTTTGSLPLSKSLLRTLLKRVSVSRRKVASFLAGTRYQSGHLTEFCRKCSLCFRSIAVSWSGNPACSIKEVARDSCSSTRLGTHRYSGDDSQSSYTQANTYSDSTHSQGAGSDPGEGSLGRTARTSSRYCAQPFVLGAGDGEFEYRIKSMNEPHERVVREVSCKACGPLTPEGLPALLALRGLHGEPAQSGVAVGDHCGNRLVDLMGNRGRQLPHRHDAIGVRQRHLRFPVSPLALAQVFLRVLALGQIEHEGDALVSVCAKSRAAGSE